MHPMVYTLLRVDNDTKENGDVESHGLNRKKERNNA
jgi:hypothetical protein